MNKTKSIRRPIRFLALAFCLALAPGIASGAAAEARRWTSVSGNQVEAILVEVGEDMAVLERVDGGGRVKIRLQDLIEEDRAYLETAVPPSERTSRQAVPPPRQGPPVRPNTMPAGVSYVGSRLELFVDRYLVDRMNHVEFRMHEPRTERIRAPFRALFATVIQDGPIYRAYYRGKEHSYAGEKFSGHPGEVTYYAESRNARRWTLPRLGLFEVNGSFENSAVLAGQPPFSHNFTPFLDTRPGVDENERYKALAGLPGGGRDLEKVPRSKWDGLHAFVSADGLHWNKVGEEPVIPYDASWKGGAFDSQNVAFWSEAEQQYVCYFRTWQQTREDSLRAISRTTSPDFRHWSRAVDTGANLPGEHLYTSQVHPYFRAPHIYIAFPTRFIPGRLGSRDVDESQGSTDILFMSWRAGEDRFERLFKEAFIVPGPDPERWENRANYAALHVVPTGPREMSLFNFLARVRYVLRTDGFISVHAGYSEGELVTRPFVFDGETLVLNYRTSAAGSIRVEIQDAIRTPKEGFSLADARPLVGDEIEGVAAWESHAELGELAGQPVRLRFVMKEADLYSFQFR